MESFEPVQKKGSEAAAPVELGDDSATLQGNDDPTQPNPARGNKPNHCTNFFRKFPNVRCPSERSENGGNSIKIHIHCSRNYSCCKISVREHETDPRMKNVEMEGPAD
eukprot:c20125_g1_i2 orf=172-495(+)